MPQRRQLDLNWQLPGDWQPPDQCLEHADGHRSEQRGHPAKLARGPVLHQRRLDRHLLCRFRQLV